MNKWYEINEINHELIKFAVILAKYKDQYIIIHNKKRSGWEIPGGNREIGESILHAASRELFEETGAIKFELIPFGIYKWNESFGMVFYATVVEINTLPEFEIEEIKFEDELPKGMNFGDMFYIYDNKWSQYRDKKLTKYKIDIRNLDEVNQLVIM